jgi:predicted MFS family arabinose efflux permease
MVAGEAAMTISLADSVFLSVSPDAARPKVLGFLLFSMLPFAVIAPWIGPRIDRIRGGQRMVVVAVGILRALVLFGMTQVLKDSGIPLFALVFSSLVLAKTYAISKSAIVPTIVTDDDALVEANGRLGQIAGITGFVVAVPVGLLQLIDSKLSLGLGILAFLFASLNAFRMPKTVIAEKPADSLEIEELHSPAVLQAALAMKVLRGAVGFNFFHLAFWLRNETAGTLWFGLALSLSGLATLAANFVGPRLRRRLREQTMIALSLLLVAVTGIAAAFSGRVVAGIIVASVVNAAAAVCRLAFEAVVQQGAPDANRGRAFSGFETQNQLAWVVAGLLPVIFSPAGWLGFAAMGVIGLVGLVLFYRFPGGVKVSRGAQARGRGPRLRSE